MIDYSSLENAIEKISPSANYWMIRTEGGDYYEGYIKGKYVAIGYNRISLKELQNRQLRNHHAKIVSERIKKFYPDNGRPTFAANVLLRFVNDVKKGDFIVVPSRNSTFVTFGMITDSKTYLKNELEPDDEIPFEKRKKVVWLRTVKRDNLNPYLFRLFYTRGAVSNANDYQDYIDKTIYPLYQKKNRVHLVLDVKTRNNINAKRLFSFGNHIFELAEGFGEENESQLPIDNVDIKLSVQSPGFIEIISYSVPVIGILGAIIVACTGGTIKLGLKTGVEFSSDGLLTSITKFLDARQERKIKAKALEEEIAGLDLKTPEELKEALKSEKKE